jgi:predicted transposase/invertase (TIGR01784 family)
MTDLEKWALFLHCANIPEYRGDRQRGHSIEGGVAGAREFVDERKQGRKRARGISQPQDVQTDMQSNIATAEDRGRQEGLQIGAQKGLQEGEQRKAFAMARNMMAAGEPVEKIARYTGLTREEVENLNV